MDIFYSFIFLERSSHVPNVRGAWEALLQQLGRPRRGRPTAISIILLRRPVLPRIMSGLPAALHDQRARCNAACFCHPHEQRENT